LRITVRASGARAVILLVACAAMLCVLPRLLSRPPSPAEAEAAVRGLWDLQVSRTWGPQIQRALTDPDSARPLAAAMARDFEDVQARRITDLRVRRSWVGPPFARRWTYFAAVRSSPGRRLEYYRLSGGRAILSSAFWWHVPLF